MLCHACVWLEFMFWMLATSDCRCVFDFDYFGLISARADFGVVVGYYCVTRFILVMVDFYLCALMFEFVV